MRTMTRFFTLGILLAASALFAHAQVAEFGLGGGVMRVGNQDDHRQYFDFEDGWRLNFRLTINNWNYFGQEFGYGYNRTKLNLQGQEYGKMAIHQGFYNFLAYATPEGSRIRPFATGGGHFSNFVPPGASAQYGQGENKFGYNYGGGIKTRVTDKFLFRVDFRQYVQGKPFGDSFPVDGSLKLNEISAGVSFIL